MADPSSLPATLDSVHDEHHDPNDDKKEPVEPPAKLFIGQIPRHISELELQGIFERYGSIEELCILRDKHTQLHRGCAFLTYTTRASADAAIASVHEKLSLHNRPIVVRYAGVAHAPIESKLFVGMLARSTGEAAIEQMFSKYGGVKEVYLMRDTNQQSKGCAFVKMNNRDEALLAINELNDVYQDQGAPRKLVVRFADSKASKHHHYKHDLLHAAAAGMMGAGGMHHPHAHHHHPSHAHLSQQQQQQQQAAATHQQHLLMQQMYNPQFAAQYASLNPYAMYAAAAQAQAQAQAAHAHAQARGMPNNAAAAAAAQNLISRMSIPYNQAQSMPPNANAYPYYQPSDYNAQQHANHPSQHHSQQPSPGSYSPQQQPQHNAHYPATTSPYELNSPHNSSTNPSAQSLASASSGNGNAINGHGGSGSSRGPPGCNLFVYNIPESFGDSDLHQMFSAFGAVLSTKVFRDRVSNVSRGFGFVSFDTVISAEKAINALNGYQLGQKRLKVMHKKSTEHNQPHNNQTLLAQQQQQQQQQALNQQQQPPPQQSPQQQPLQQQQSNGLHAGNLSPTQLNSHLSSHIHHSHSHPHQLPQQQQQQQQRAYNAF